MVFLGKNLAPHQDFYSSMATTDSKVSTCTTATAIVIVNINALWHQHINSSTISKIVVET
jgi:hypothetical protein